MPDRLVGTWRLFAPSAELLELAVEEAVRRQLQTAADAYTAGNGVALRHAIELCREHLPSTPWPAWVQEGVLQELSNSGVGESVHRRRGRHARTGTRRRDDVCDVLRAGMLEWLMCDGLSKAAAAGAVSVFLQGCDAGASPIDVIRSHARVSKRMKDEPYRYFPFA